MARVGYIHDAEETPAAPSALARWPLVTRPTPCYRLVTLGREWRHTELYVKREDLTAPGYGGNKVRNLEYLFGTAAERQAQRLVTVAPLGSNFVAALARHGARSGFTVEVHHFVAHRNAQIEAHARFSARSGAALTAHAEGWPVVPAASLAGLAAIRSALREDAFFVAPGGSDAIGAMGHVGAALELVAQVERGEIPKPDVV